MTVEPSSPIRLVFLLSGSGTTLQNLLNHIDRGDVEARVQLVISSDPEAHGLVRARNHDIPTEVVQPDVYDSNEEFSKAISAEIDQVEPDLICMGGFMHFYTVPERYRYQVINIHPSLLPKHGGQGYYGRHVHEAVLDAGDDTSGCTVHFVTNDGYDKGPVIRQETVPVQPDDTPESLKRRVKQKERELYPETVQLFADGRIDVEQGNVTIEGPDT